VLAQEAVNTSKDPSGVNANRHAGESALKHSPSARRAEALPGDIRDEESGAVIAHGKKIEVSPPTSGGVVDASASRWVKSRKPGKKGLLDIASDLNFLFEALAVAFPFDQRALSRIPGGFDAQGVKDLAVELRKRGRGGASPGK